jgi:hypothetical protein
LKNKLWDENSHKQLKIEPYNFKTAIDYCSENLISNFS